MRTLPPAITQAFPLLLAIGTGILLGLPRAMPELAPLQVAGFAGFFLLAHHCKRVRDGIKFGALAGLMAAISALILVHVHLVAALALLLSISFNYALFGGLLLWLLRRGALAAFVAGAGVITLGEWGVSHLFPLFGSAQYTTCPWSAWPELVRHEAVIGSGGTLLLALLLGAGLAGAVLRKDRVRAMAVLMITGALGAGLGTYARYREETGKLMFSDAGTVRVAAVAGPVWESPAAGEKNYAPLVAQAAAQGASVVVLPEIALADDGTDATLHHFGALARAHQITLVVGLLDNHSNKALVIGPDGRLLAAHIKTHHIPFMENYREQGDGTPALAQLPNGPRLGVMICQDDNFTGLANATARAGAQLFTVPTLDWRGVEIAHFTNARHRALETGTGLVRAAHGGITAIFAPDGSVLAQRNHLTQGDGIIVADLPLAGAPTPFVRFGDGPLLVLAALAAMGGLMMGHPLKMSIPPPNQA